LQPEAANSAATDKNSRPRHKPMMSDVRDFGLVLCAGPKIARTISKRTRRYRVSQSA